MARILVTGGTGFLGSHLVESLLESGHKVVVVDNLWRGKKKNLANAVAKWGQNLVFLEGDAALGAVLELAVEKIGGKVDIIYHLAAVNGTKWFNERPDLVVDVNIKSTQAAIAFALKHNARLVFTSSPEACGEQTMMPLSESSESVFPPAQSHQRHSYGASKYLGEILVHHAVKACGLDACIIRPFNAYGPRLPSDEYGQIVSIFIAQALAGKPLTLHKDGSQTRSFTYVDDITSALVLAGVLDSSADGTQTLTGVTLNVGMPKEITMRELAQMILEVTGSESMLKSVQGYHGDSLRRIPNISQTTKLLGWVPRIGLAEGLRLTLNEWME